MNILYKIWRKTECPSPTYVLFGRILLMKQSGNFEIKDLIPRFMKNVYLLEGRKYYYWLHYAICDGK
jgi:hypothetical protein